MRKMQETKKPPEDGAVKVVKCMGLLPIPDELIRSVAAKQLGEVFNLRAAVPNRAFGE